MTFVAFLPKDTQLDNGDADIVIDGAEKEYLLDGTNFTFV